MQVTSNNQLQIPESLKAKLLDFRGRVWRLKMFEAFAAAVIGILVGFLLTYTLDRLFDTPAIIRTVIFFGAIAACALVPVGLERWVWRRRRMDQLARLLSQTHPSAGDQLLGVIELSEDSSEQSRSPELVEAAIKQVAENVEQQDLRGAIPNPQHIQRGYAVGFLGFVAVALLLFTAAAAKNAWARFLKPWGETPRYTFAAIEPLPERIVVPHGESFDVAIKLQESTQWKPSKASVNLAGHTAEEADLADDSEYHFELPGQIADSNLNVRVGDFAGETKIEPMLRPELSGLSAAVKLPDYLGRKKLLEKSIRGATLTVVKGSETTLTATASRELSAALVNGKPQSTTDSEFSTPPVKIDGTEKIEMQWEDQFGLSGKRPFELTIEGVDDEMPTLICENLPRRKVLLDTEVLTFKVRARDDFGVKRVGIQWVGLDETVQGFAKGEKVIGAGDYEAEFLELAATFSAKENEIAPQPLAVRVFVEDYFPDRPRIYSPTCVFNVLNAEQHAIWVTAELSRWHRMSLDVRDREMQLYETNKQLRDMSPEQLDRPENRRLLASQAQGERANGRRLTNLTSFGEMLLKEAMRNPEIGVGHLDKWAEMMQVLKDISGNRMPSVADLLKQASKAPAKPSSPPSQQNQAPKAGQNRLTQSGAADPKKPGEPKDPTKVPTISDVESSHHQPESKEPSEPQEDSGGKPRLTLPTTMLAGGGQKSDQPPPPANEQVDEAVEQQEDLLAEFEKIVDELNNVLANLEGSTLVKRLKASSRKQQQVAMKLGSMVADTFGVSNRQKEGNADTFAKLSETESVSSQEASHIMDDMAAYFERSRFMRFKVVLDDMRDQDVTAGLRHLSDDLKKENGLSISQAEYWSENFDRWAEDLVEVTKGGL